MLNGKYVIRLKEHHDKMGLSAYQVAKEIGNISKTTVYRYVSEDSVEVDNLNTTVALLAKFYGVNLWDVVKFESVEEEIDEETKTPLVA